jgi:hypothetical protein
MHQIYRCIIRNIIIGLDKFPMFDSDLFSQNNDGGLYVNLDPRSLKQILKADRGDI